jgi:5-methylcytosine-specific restriction endonuclease McrA
MYKKVILILVEGDSDEALLIDRLRVLYSACDIRFEVQKGDIFYGENRNKPIKEIIGKVIKKIIKKRKFLPKDILTIVHIMDTDGCFIPDTAINIVPNQIVKTQYNLNSITVDDQNQRERIIKRNRIRSINVKTMNNIFSVVGKRYKYQLYYFSRTLEHVIFDDLNPVNETKYENIEEFINYLNIDLEVFLKNYFPNISNGNYEFEYKKTWEYIVFNMNSLQRKTNLPLMFEYIDSLI